MRHKPIHKRAVAVSIGVIMLGTVLGVFLHMQSVKAGAPLGHHNENGVAGTYWSMPDARFSQPFTVTTDPRPFTIGDTVTMPNGLQLRVTRVERNWQPSSAQATFGKTPDTDNPAGREIIRVWFTAADVGQDPVAFNNFFFTLQRAGRPEQRVAVLSVLPPTSYGSMGKVPWLLPGESTETYVPFLINPGEAPESFQYYYYAPSHKVIDRLSVELKASSQPAAQTANVYTFAGTKSITVR
jgi:hypothetical protein